MFENVVLHWARAGWERYGWLEQLPSGQLVAVDVYCHWRGEHRGTP